MTNQMSDHFVLPEAPPIPGLAFRHFRDERDFALIADLINRTNLADRVDSVMTAETLANWFSPGPDSDADPFADIIVATIDGIHVAFGMALTYQESSGTRVYLPQGRVLPTWRRKGLGRAILHHNERRLCTIAVRHPAGDPRAFLTYVYAAAPGVVALLTQEGYQPVRQYYSMVRAGLADIPAAPLPNGIEVRPVQPEHYRQIWDADQEAFQDHWGYFRATEQDYQNWLKEPHFDPTLWRVAWAGEQIAGQVRSFINAQENEAFHRLRGYTEYISVRRAWRRRGLARALIARSLEALQARGMTEAALRVDTENTSGALGLYETCGFRVQQQSTEYRKAMD